MTCLVSESDGFIEINFTVFLIVVVEGILRATA